MSSGRGWWLAVLVAAAWSPARAANYCVDSALELQEVLDTAAQSPADDLIRIERGLYAIPAGLGYFPPTSAGSSSGRLTLRGGYDNGCLGAVEDVTNTTLTGQDAPNAHVAFGSLSDSLELSNLTFGSIQRLRVSTVSCASGGELDIVLSRIQVADSADGIDVVSQCGDVRVENTIAAYNDGYGLRFRMGAAHRFTLVNSTLRGNGNGLRSNPFDAVDRPVRVYNSILTGNGAADIVHNGQADWINAHSIIGTIVGGPLPGTGNTSGDPALASDHRPVEPLSPAINTGTATVFGGLPIIDAGGDARVIGGVVDRGAFESGVDSGADLVVTNTNDAGTGSLRAAILDANGIPGLQTIRFAIPGACPRVIDLATQLPALTGPTLVDGYTQAGSVVNRSVTGFDATICVVLRNPVFQTQYTHGLFIQPVDPNDAITIRGLAFSGILSSNGFGGAIFVNGGTGHRIEGNQFGGNVGGVALTRNTTGIWVQGPAYGVTIGGRHESQRNLIGNAGDAGVRLSNTREVALIENLIGLNATGSGALPNRYGVVVDNSPANVLLGNYIGGNNDHGVLILGRHSDNNWLQENRIGLRAFALCFPFPCNPDYRLPNLGHGVMIVRGASDLPQEVPFGSILDRNIIAYNAGDGVRVLDGAYHDIRGRIYANDGLAIDLGGNGRDSINDDSAQGSYPNGGLNAPQLVLARGSTYAGTIAGLLTTRSGTYDLQFYSTPACDPSGAGEADSVLMGTTSVIVSGSGGMIEAPFSATVTSGIALGGRFITATVQDGLRSTSEMSNCVNYRDVVVFADGFEDSEP